MDIPALKIAFPRRLSVGDEGFDPALAARLIIRLDGVEQSKVISYDLDAQCIVRFKLDDAGRIVVDREREEAVTEEVHGTVEVTIGRTA